MGTWEETPGTKFLGRNSWARISSARGQASTLIVVFLGSLTCSRFRSANQIGAFFLRPFPEYSISHHFDLDVNEQWIV
jgi:hypothetical protein